MIMKLLVVFHPIIQEERKHDEPVRQVQHIRLSYPLDSRPTSNFILSNSNFESLKIHKQHERCRHAPLVGTILVGGEMKIGGSTTVVHLNPKDHEYPYY
jgi:hypothetical protein